MPRATLRAAPMPKASRPRSLASRGQARTWKRSWMKWTACVPNWRPPARLHRARSWRRLTLRYANTSRSWTATARWMPRWPRQYAWWQKARCWRPRGRPWAPAAESGLARNRCRGRDCRVGQGHPIATLVLGAVQRRIGGADHLFRQWLLAGLDHVHADADGQRDRRTAFIRRRGLHAQAHGVGRFQRGIRIHAGQQRDELLATEAR